MLNSSTPGKMPPKQTSPVDTRYNITIPLLDKFKHTHPLKFHPQQCVYTDGSFILPTKNSEGQIEGNTAMYIAPTIIHKY
jgi:hypothetical protein